MLFYLLRTEIVSHKVLLQFFIGIVDAELLQVIDAEALKTVHIQNSWKIKKAVLTEASLKK